jgi:hypothetical protein
MSSAPTAILLLRSQRNIHIVCVSMCVCVCARYLIQGCTLWVRRAQRTFVDSKCKYKY